MKKVLIIAGIVLMAAGCSSTTNKTQNDSAQTTPTPTTQNSPTPTATATPTSGAMQTPTPTSSGAKTFSMAEVQKANTPENCYSTINGKIYDLTAWINKHPGGDKNILKICGKDGSSAFNGQHGGQSQPETVLAGFQIGILK
jgi:cytochrome b involved in lipid metabolism